MTPRACWRLAALAGGLAAGLGLGACAPAYDMDTLLRQLQSNDIEVRQEAEEKIEKIVHQGDYSVFVRGAQSPVKTMRAPSMMYLAHMKQPEARAALRDLLRLDRRSMLPFNPIRMKASSEESDSRILAAHLISENGGDPQALPILLEGVQGQPPDVLTATCFAVGALHDPAGVPFLVASIKDTHVEVVRAATEALGLYRTPAAIEGLKTLLHHPSQEVRSEMLSALELQENPAIVPILEDLADADPLPEIRAGAMSQLSRFRKPPPVPFLIRQLGSKDPLNRSVALDTLRQVSGQMLGPRPDLWNRWWAEAGKNYAPGR